MRSEKRNTSKRVGLDAAIKAFAHPLRREILGWLKDPAGNFPDQEMPHDLGVCAGQIDRKAGLSQSTVSSHLALLQKAGLVRVRKIGQWSFFQRDEEAIRSIVQELSREL